jgi:hypothetical protein
MPTLKPLKFISVEGFWEKPIHEQRVAAAAEKLQEDPLAFAIATATHAPASCTSFTDEPLGQYTARTLINDYKIAPMRILPAYLFPQKTTYTIIDAYSNAIMIGWLCCGLSKSATTVEAELEPVSAGFNEQRARIVTLNTRALKILRTLSVQVAITPTPAYIPFAKLLEASEEERSKLAKIQEPDGVIATGCWHGNSGVHRSFDNIEAMHNEIALAFTKVFGDKISTKKLFNLSPLERFMLTLIWNIKANTKEKSVRDWQTIYSQLNNYFTEKLNTAALEAAKNKLIEYC